MKSAISLIVLALVALAGITSIIFATSILNEKAIYADNLFVTTDKDVYHSKELMRINISLISKENLDDVCIKVEGIKDRRGNNRLSKEIHTNLIKGLNIKTLDYELPSCSKCAGILPGEYYINASVAYNNRTVTANHSIFIE